MKTSIEITLMPLNDDYKSIIKKFITSLRESNFQILENPLSTQIFGELEPTMLMLIEKINNIFSACDGIMVNLKIVKGNRFHYKPDF
ncbi:MAG: hypothetical protein CMC09_03925 [Flavobacteriaceae bacterium]|nr:hypothetical protein [Flavobacteriaceae bacterium]|tara:strand:+ start:545 stop:805 length:261 start_codon:yes stop_codon:yes gene_type:complete